jgi:hypothetical protein
MVVLRARMVQRREHPYGRHLSIDRERSEKRLEPTGFDWEGTD